MDDDGAWLAVSLPHVEAWRVRSKPRSHEGTLISSSELGASLRSALRNLGVDVPGTYVPKSNLDVESESTASDAASVPAFIERVLSKGTDWSAHEKALMLNLLDATEPLVPPGSDGRLVAISIFRDFTDALNDRLSSHLCSTLSNSVTVAWVGHPGPPVHGREAAAAALLHEYRNVKYNVHRVDATEPRGDGSATVWVQAQRLQGSQPSHAEVLVVQVFSLPVATRAR